MCSGFDLNGKERHQDQFNPPISTLSQSDGKGIETIIGRCARYAMRRKQPVSDIYTI